MRVLFPILTALLATSLAAQLPRGHAVYSRLLNPGVPSVPGGLVTLHPTHGNFQDVTGLPGLLTGSVYSQQQPYGVGANAVLVREGDGSIFVAPVVRQANPLEIYRITLNGTAATVAQTYYVGTPSIGVLVDQMAWLPSGEILFCHRGAMAGFPAQGIAKLDPATGAVTSIPYTIPPGFVLNALAVDPDGTTAYVGTFGIPTGPNPFQGQVFALPLPNGGVPTPVLQSANLLDGVIVQLHVECTGRLLAGVQGTSSTSGLVAIDVAAGTATQLTPISNLNAMSVDEVTGDVLLANIGAASGTSAMYRFDGALTAISGMPGWDTPTGMAIRPSLASYGSVPASAPENTRWQVCRNPGGAPLSPLTGSNPFSITLDVTQNAHVGAVLFSLGSTSSTTLTSPPVANALLDPALLIGPAITLIPTGVPATYTFPLTIPANFGAMELFAQPFHWDPAQGQFVGGEGLVVGIH